MKSAIVADSWPALPASNPVSRSNFLALTDKCIRRGVFHDVNELEQAIHHYIDRHNQKPKPYLWTAKATDILEKVKRACAALRARGYVPKNQKFVALQGIDRRLSAELG